MVSQASDNLSQTASNAQDEVASFQANLEERIQDEVASFQANLEERIKNNPLVAIGVAISIGFVLGKIT